MKRVRHQPLAKGVHQQVVDGPVEEVEVEVVDEVRRVQNLLGPVRNLPRFRAMRSVRFAGGVHHLRAKKSAIFK